MSRTPEWFFSKPEFQVLFTQEKVVQISTLRKKLSDIAQYNDTDFANQLDLGAWKWLWGISDKSSVGGMISFLEKLKDITTLPELGERVEKYKSRRDKRKKRAEAKRHQFAAEPLGIIDPTLKIDAQTRERVVRFSLFPPQNGKITYWLSDVDRSGKVCESQHYEFLASSSVTSEIPIELTLPRATQVVFQLHVEVTPDGTGEPIEYCVPVTAMEKVCTNVRTPAVPFPAGQKEPPHIAVS